MCGRCRDCKQLFEPNERAEKPGGLPGQTRPAGGLQYCHHSRHLRIDKALGARMAMLKTKSVHSPIEPEDGLRILATRGRGRGLPADRFDVWMANLGPSEELRDAILAGRIS